MVKLFDGDNSCHDNGGDTVKKLLEFIKKYKLLSLTVVLYAVAFFVKPDVFYYALNMTKYFLIEMVEILPPILVISSLIMVWVPQEVIMNTFGEKSGFKGKLLSLLLGAFSAGPIYAAFPVGEALFLKGASVSNITILISSWAVVKATMFMVESSFLGMAFATTRYMLTIPAIFVMGYIMEKLVTREDVLKDKEFSTPSEYKNAKEVLRSLPNMNCGACGYGTCEAFANAVVKGEVTIDDCVVRSRMKLKSVEEET